MNFVAGVTSRCVCSFSLPAGINRLFYGTLSLLPQSYLGSLS
jgi:hypothetical protein